MIIDTALRKRAAEGKPVRVGMVGAGFMGKAVARQICAHTPGMTLAAIANRHVEEARRAYAGAGVEPAATVSTVAALEECIARGAAAVTDDAELLCQAGGLDAILEITGAVEFSAGVALAAIAHGKHVILMNAELDGTLGPLLQVYAARAGVVLTNADGDQPGVTMNLLRFVRMTGCAPVLAGNIKGLHDPYRTPTTQQAFAARWGQHPQMVTSFADGSKIAFEQAVIANATGMRVGRRGMFGPTVPAGTPVTEAAAWYPLDAIDHTAGIVDYVVGAHPAPGVFVLATQNDPAQRHMLNLYKLGEGPYYCFYVPYHLCHFEVPITIARAVLFGDAAIAPQGPPVVGVFATAKTALEPGAVLDGPGGYCVYGQCENYAALIGQDLLPLGLAEGCRVTRPVPRDRALTWDDVQPPVGRLSHRLYREQMSYFGLPSCARVTPPAPPAAASR